MTVAELKDILSKLGLNQSEFARLIGVTSRAVALWMAEDRAIPGPIEAYAQLLATCPPSVRQIELARLKKGKTDMREGMYSVTYSSTGGVGAGFLVLDNGRAYGGDPFGGKYDGDYTYNEGTGMADLRLKLTFAPNAPAVFGISHPYEWAIEVTAHLDPRVEKGTTRIATHVGPAIEAHYQYIRALPEV